MTGKDARNIRERVDQEGFDYAFVHYTDFDEVVDGAFHELRLAFLAAREELIEYCGLEDC
jgi:hypothetical protein